MLAALECGVSDIAGIDGVSIAEDQLLFPAELFRQFDLTKPWDLGRQFDAALCLEVAEHLDEQHAPTLIDALTHHSDCVIFSAACPGQRGQNHINCQWPEYWQRLFNERGFTCSDEVRWRLWRQRELEPWYRQNLFTARRVGDSAGQEPRIAPTIHPEMLPWLDSLQGGTTFASSIQMIEDGALPWRWYWKCPLHAMWRKVSRRLDRP